MKTTIGGDRVWRVTNVEVSVADSALVMSTRPVCRAEEAPLLRRQQPSPDKVEVSQRRRDFEAVQVLGEAAVADLLEAEHPLDHPDGVLDLSAHLRLGAVLRLFQLVDPTFAAVPAVREVLRPWSTGTDRLRLPLITLAAPHPRLAPIQQLRKPIDIAHIPHPAQD